MGNPTLKEKIEGTLACEAYAEMGEPCPIDIGKKEKSAKKTGQSIEDTMACAAYAEEGLPCPIGTEEKKTG